MKIKLVLILAILVVLAGCRTNRMAAVERPEFERPAIEKETETVVEVDADTGIMSLEEHFTFTSDFDKSMHDDYTYFVIIGSFRQKDNAQRFMETLYVKGLEPVILLSETGLHRISVGSFERENDARSIIMQIRSDFKEHEDTWLLIRKQ